MHCAGAPEARRHAQDSGYSVDHSYLRERQGSALDRLKSETRRIPAPHLDITTTVMAAFTAHTVAQAMFCDVTRFELMYKRLLGGYEARYGAG